VTKREEIYREVNPSTMPSRWRAVGKRGIADSTIGYAVLVGAVFVFGWFSKGWVARLRGAAKEAGGMVGDFEAGKAESRAANAAAAKGRN
jgi:hypothetical protein